MCHLFYGQVKGCVQNGSKLEPVHTLTFGNRATISCVCVCVTVINYDYVECDIPPKYAMKINYYIVVIFDGFAIIFWQDWWIIIWRTRSRVCNTMEKY